MYIKQGIMLTPLVTAFGAIPILLCMSKRFSSFHILLMLSCNNKTYLMGIKTIKPWKAALYRIILERHIHFYHCTHWKLIAWKLTIIFCILGLSTQPFLFCFVVDSSLFVYTCWSCFILASSIFCMSFSCVLNLARRGNKKEKANFAGFRRALTWIQIKVFALEHCLI